MKVSKYRKLPGLPYMRNHCVECGRALTSQDISDAATEWYNGEQEYTCYECCCDAGYEPDEEERGGRMPQKRREVNDT